MDWQNGLVTQHKLRLFDYKLKLQPWKITIYKNSEKIDNIANRKLEKKSMNATKQKKIYFFLKSQLSNFKEKIRRP